MKNDHYQFSRFLLILLLSSTWQVSCTFSPGGLSAPSHLKSSYQTNPKGLLPEAPFFTWWVEAGQNNTLQTAWRIQVATDSAALEEGQHLLWDSGKQAAGREPQVIYNGPPLEATRQYFWRVRSWNGADQASPYSDIANWETGPGQWQAQWIGDGSEPFADRPEFFNDHPAPLFRKTFAVEEQPRSARLFISGLGYYEAYLNGEKIGPAVLDPGWTNYGKRILYATYDVTGLLRDDQNVLGVLLGDGWYNPKPINHFGRFNLRETLTIGQPKLIAELHLSYPDGRKEVITSDGSWKQGDSWILYNDVYLGERQDGRLKIGNWTTTNFDDSQWKNAAISSAPGGVLIPQQQPAIEITKRLPAQQVTQLAPGVQVVDFGQNFAGWIRLRVNGQAGDTLRLRYGELLHEDGSVNGLTAVATQIKEAFRLSGGPGVPLTAWQEDTYILGGDGEEIFQQHFTFHGFRYVQIWGYPGELRPEDIEGLRLSANLGKAGSFTSSNEDFNRIQEICEWTFLSNVFSIESDCPGREKFGYGGDIVAAGEAYLFNYDMANFYRKTVRDFADDARPLGGMPELAPDVGIASQSPGDSSGPIGWQLAYPFLQDQLYRFYGDRQLLEQQYPVCKKLVGFLQSVSENNRIDIGLSDHELLNEKPEAFTSTAFYYHIVKLTARFAGILGHSDDQQQYTQLAKAIAKVLVRDDYREETGCFANCNQTAQAFGIWYELVNQEEKEKAYARLEDSIRLEWKGHLSTGIFGTKMLLDIFRRDKRADLAYLITDQTGFPGWRYMLANGATTLWENWSGSDNTFSQNHPMFGSISEWFYRSVLGINPAEDAVGCDRWELTPLLTEQVPEARGEYISVRGVVKSSYQRQDDQLAWLIEIPPNTRARIHVPFSGFNNPGIRVNDQLVFAGGVHQPVDDIALAGLTGQSITLEVGSGSYQVLVSP